jgi:hypothetical protein
LVALMADSIVALPVRRITAVDGWPADFSSTSFHIPPWCKGSIFLLDPAFFLFYTHASKKQLLINQF